jgi:hypothetical protein
VADNSQPTTYLLNHWSYARDPLMLGSVVNTLA